MSTRTEREKNKKQHDRHLSLLMELLREDQNRYCADCRSKGPRWSSWNLGIFVCITCAGIHRNLGVHISKVKSVNLDAWTPEQIKNVQEWGNKRAGEYYEYHLPDGFRRPQGDSGLEQFVRNKYEKKLYISKEGPPPPREVKPSQEKTSKERKISNDSENKKLQQISRPELPKPVKNNVSTKDAKLNKAEPKVEPLATTADLLSLSEPAVPQNSTLLSMASNKQENTADLLNFGGSSFQPANNNPTAPSTSSQGFSFDLAQTMSQPAPISNTISNDSAAPSSRQKTIEDDLFKGDMNSGNQSTKDSIMALYQPSQKQANPQMFGVPGGVYLQQQQQQQQQQNNAVPVNQANTMPAQYNVPYNAQQQQMYQVNQVQQQMAKLGFAQQPSIPNNQAVPNNRDVPNSQAMPGYNYTNQAMPGVLPHNSGTPAQYGNTAMVNGGWTPHQGYPAQQPMPQYLTTGPTGPGYTMYDGQAGMPSGQTLSNNLWK